MPLTSTIATLLRWGKRLAWAWLAVVTGATVLVVARHPRPITPAFSGPIPVVAAGTSVDLARYDRGAQIQVSSYMSMANHHPIFAIDGLGDPDEPGAVGSSRRGQGRAIEPLMKWVSADSDSAPWLIVRWPWPVDLDEMRLVHAGRIEGGEYTMRDFTIACLDADDVPRVSVPVHDNRDPISRHPLACQGVTALRIDFTVDAAKDSPRSVVRLYEVEALGRPHQAPPEAP